MRMEEVIKLIITAIVTTYKMNCIGKNKPWLEQETGQVNTLGNLSLKVTSTTPKKV